MSIGRLVENGQVVNADLIELYDFFGEMRRRWWLIASIAVIFGVLAGVLAFLMQPVYRGYAVLDPVTSDSNPLTSSMMSSGLSALGGSLAAITGGVTEGDQETDEAMTVLKSREFTYAFIERNNLLPLLFPRSWDARSGQWKAGRKVPSLARGFIAFDDIRKIDRDSNNDFVTIQIDWPDRVKAAEWVNQMGQMLNEELRRRALTEADASLVYLRAEWVKTEDAETREAVSRLIESQLRKRMLAAVTPEFELRFIDRALTPDADYPLRPNKPLMIVIGLVLGALIGIAVVILLYRRKLVAAGEL